MTICSYNLLDGEATTTVVLPNSAGAVFSTTLGIGPLTTHGACVHEFMDMEVVYPALTTTQLPDGATATYSIQTGWAADGSDAIAYIPAVVVQTGAAGSGAAGGSVRFDCGSAISRYIRLAITTASSPGDCSGATATLQGRF